MVKPLGGCSKVIETTKAFAEMKGFHHLESKGIVDRDRRTPHEIKYLRERNIYVPDVAEVENLLMLEPIIRVIARRMLQNEDEVFHAVKQNVIALFKKRYRISSLTTHPSPYPQRNRIHDRPAFKHHRRVYPAYRNVDR